MKFKGTQGKWFACCKSAKPHFLFTDDGNTTICAFSQKQDDGRELPLEEVQANARLIESAPQLLEALEHTLEILYMCDPPKHLVETYANAFANYTNLIHEI